MKVLFFLPLIILSAYSFDQKHTLWGEVLQESLVENEISNLVNYKKLKKDPTKLKSYLKQLEELSQKEFAQFETKEKLAFWINAYNAYTLKLIIDHYPIKSIKDIEGDGLFGWGSPWGKKFITLFKKKTTLDHIEHQIIRKNFSEPRIHFAVNCASMGCPSLSKTPYTANKLDEQLQTNTLRFLRNPHKNKINHKTKRLQLSKIFEWYGDDFKKEYKSYLLFIKETLELPQKIEDYKLHFERYDWRLNDTKSSLVSSE